MKKYFCAYLFIQFYFVTICSYAVINNKESSDTNSLVSLKQNIRKIFDDSLFAHAHWGVLIKSLKTGEVWYERNSEKMFIPASNEKVLTAAATLLTLGSGFTFETYLNYDGEIKDSVLTGNLIVFGNGDPTLNEEFLQDPREVFLSWANIIKKKGIKQINGDVIGDDNAFEDYPFGFGWSFDELIEPYAAEINSLQLNENCVDVYVIPPKNMKGKIKVEMSLPNSYISVENKLTLSDTGTTTILYNRQYGTNSIILSGNVRTGSNVKSISISISNPTLFYTTVLKNVLEENGIKISGQAKDCDDISEWKSTIHNLKPIDIHYSTPLKEILAVMMKQSQNLCAESIIRTLGWQKTGIGSFSEGRKIVEYVLNNMGIKLSTYSFMDGSGLSRYNLVSPKIIIQVLEQMKKSLAWQDWINLFPIAGNDGTLKHRMKGTMAEGNVRAKTGTMSNIRGLSGYITTADGEELIFSFLVNGHLRTNADTDYITDSILKLISEFKRQKP